jgi:cobyrinic acid a,c-diamide synthase
LRPLIIAAPASGSGKTSVALGLMGLLRRMGRQVAPFKVGPDFIDPGHHSRACGRPSRNLDGWMCTQDAVKQTFEQGCKDADVAVIEGVMGLFDGASGRDNVGSTAEIASILNGQILLVVDARSQARSAAALVKGFAEFSPGVNVSGVIFNRVASTNHAALLSEAMLSIPGLPPVLGYLPRAEELSLPERHLGLTTAGTAVADDYYERLADWVSAALDVGQLMALLTGSRDDAGRCAQAPSGSKLGNPVRIGIARDEAFCFYYAENLELLERAGAELVFFSPLTASHLPENLQGLYLGGGYPELHAEALAANRGLLAALKSAALSGLPIYAECGGFMLLAEAIEQRAMAGVFPAQAKMLSRRKALGYREVELSSDCLLGPAGTIVRGHEFHYSEMAPPQEIERVYLVKDRRGQPVAQDGCRIGKTLGSYIHLHFGSNPQVAENFVSFCRDNSRQPQGGC